MQLGLFLFKKGPQKVVDELLNQSNLNYLNEEKFESKIDSFTSFFDNSLEISEVYQDTNSEISPLQLTKYLFTQTQKLSSWKESLRALLLLHRLAHTARPEFVYDFSKQKWPDYAEQRKKGKQSYRILAHLAVVELYKNYLVKLVYNYDDFRAAFVHSTDTHRQLVEQNLSLLHLLSKFQNILGFLFKFDQLFEVCLIQFPNENIVKQAAHYLLTDCYHFYTFISKNIQGIIDQIFNLPTHEAIFLYEIYSENIHLTKKLKRIMEFKALLHDFECLEPLYFALPSEEVKKIEVYIHSLKARVQIGRMMKVEIDLKHAHSGDLEPSKNNLETDYSQKRVKSQMHLDDYDDNEQIHSKKLYTDNEVANFSKNILNSVTPSFDVLSHSSFNTIFLSPKKKEIEQNGDHKIEQETKRLAVKVQVPQISVKYEPLTTLEQIVNHEEDKNEYEVFECYQKSVKEIADKSTAVNEGNPKPKKAMQRTLTLGKFVTGANNQQPQVYIAANDSTPNQTPNESFSDSFIRRVA